MSRLLERHEVRELVRKAMADAEADIFHAIKANSDDRASLLSQLDVLSRLGDRVNARIEYTDPLAD